LMRAADAFVETDRRFEFRLQLCVIDNFVMRQRLLDHHEVELVKFLQAIDIVERVCRICVGHQFDIRKRRPHFESRRRPSPA
jgi:hypothetical protein